MMLFIFLLPQILSGIYAEAAAVLIQNPLSAEITYPFSLTCQDGAIDLTISGGFSPYEVQWFKNGQPIGDPVMSYGDEGTEDITGIGVGTYHVEVYDALCGFATAIYQVAPVFNLIELIDIQQASWCSPESQHTGGGYISSMDGSLTLRINYEGEYTFSWMGPNGPVPGGESLSHLCAGTYTIVVRNSIGCQQSRSFDICCCVGGDYLHEIHDLSAMRLQQCPVQYGEIPVCDGSVTIPLTIYEGEWWSPDDADRECDGYIYPDVNGGNANTTYTWTLPDGGMSGGQILSQLCPGTYCLTVSDGCSEVSRCWTLVDCREVDIVLQAAVEESCGGDGAVILSVSGGVWPYKYQWSNFRTGSSISGLSPGEYCVTVTDANGCREIDCFFVPAAQIEERHLGDCEFALFCKNQMIFGSLRSGNLEITVNQSNCHRLHRICYDDFFAGGSEQLQDIVTAPWFEKNESILDPFTDCPIMIEWCRGPDMLAGTADDIIARYVDITIVVKEPFDDSDTDCRECWYIELCKYSLPESFSDDDRYHILTAEPKWVVELDDNPGSLCLETSCHATVYCYLEKGNLPAAQYVWFTDCLPTHNCDSEPDFSFEDLMICTDVPPLSVILNAQLTDPDIESDLMTRGDIGNIGEEYVALPDSDIERWSFTVFPNPFTNKVHLMAGLESGIIDKLSSSVSISVRIYSTTGVLLDLVTDLTIGAGVIHTFNTGHYPSGFYLMEITGDDMIDRHVLKLMKVHE